MVVTVIVGVVKLLPLVCSVPPVNASYQLIVAVPDEAVAPKLTVPASQRAAGAVLVIVGVVFTVAITATLGLLTQVPFVAPI